jgi:hypothetical protein
MKLHTLAMSSMLSIIPDGNSGAEPTSCEKYLSSRSDERRTRASWFDII